MTDTTHTPEAVLKISEAVMTARYALGSLIYDNDLEAELDPVADLLYDAETLLDEHAASLT